MNKKTINKLHTLLSQNGLTYSYTPGIADVTIVTNVTWIADPKNRKHLDVHAIPNTGDAVDVIGNDTFWGTVIVPNRG